MQKMMRTLIEAERGEVLRVRLDPAGIAEAQAAAGYDRQVAAELLDEAGEVCGRLTRRPDPCAQTYGSGLCWHAQLGGVMSSRRWAGVPMGCGAGHFAAEAVAAAIDNLRGEARRRESAARVFACFLADRA